MEIELFQSCTAESLREHGHVTPGGTNAWFSRTQKDRAPALFLTPDTAQCWCYPPISDRNLCFFFSPSRLRLGVDRCQNKDELWSFYSDRRDLTSDYRQVHLFAALTWGEWWYLGKPILESGFGSNGMLDQFEIGLDEKLPEWLWLQFGGYRGWLICTGQAQYVVKGPSEAEYLLTQYWGTVSQTMEISRYQGDALFAATDNTHAAVLYYSNGSKHLHTAGTDYGEDNETYAFLDFEFPRRWMVSRQQAIELIRRYLETGRPAGLSEE
jgi:hypothetical protein